MRLSSSKVPVESASLGGRKGNGRVRAHWDRVESVTTFEPAEVERDVSLQRANEPDDALDGVESVVENVDPGVPTSQAGKHDTSDEPTTWNRVCGGGPSEDRPSAAGASARQFAKDICVKVQHRLSVNQIGIQVVCTLECGFLFDGEEEFKGTMRRGVALGEAHCGGNSDTVVGAERAMWGDDPFAIADDFDIACHL